MFADRRDAGRLLAAELRGYAPDRPIVLGIPRGGVIVAAEVARALAGDLDIVVARKIGHPSDPEYAVGAVDATGRVVAGDSGGAREWLAEEGARQRVEAARREDLYRGGAAPAPVEGRTVIVVDDGIATGLTVRAAVEGLAGRGASKVVVAAPVAAPQAVRALEAVADDVVVLEAPLGFRAVGTHYRDFAQTSDAEVLAELGSFPR